MNKLQLIRFCLKIFYKSILISFLIIYIMYIESFYVWKNDILINFDMVPEKIIVNSTTKNSTDKEINKHTINIDSTNIKKSQQKFNQEKNLIIPKEDTHKNQELLSIYIEKFASPDLIENSNQKLNDWNIWDSFVNSDYSSFCNNFKKFCKSIIFNSQFSSSEKLKYYVIVAYVLNFLETNLQTNENILDVILNINLYKEKWVRRWFAWTHTLNLYIWSMSSNQEFLQILTHELWHIIDLWVLIWIDEKKNSSFTEYWYLKFPIDDPSINFYKISWLSENIRKTNSSYKDFVSWYSMTNPFEDFAECFNMYVNNYEYFKKVKQSNLSLELKFDYIEKIIWKKYINKNINKIDIFEKSDARRPRDSSKM